MNLARRTKSIASYGRTLLFAVGEIPRRMGIFSATGRAAKFMNMAVRRDDAPGGKVIRGCDCAGGPWASRNLRRPADTGAHQLIEPGQDRSMFMFASGISPVVRIKFGETGARSFNMASGCASTYCGSAGCEGRESSIRLRIPDRRERFKADAQWMPIQTIPARNPSPKGPSITRLILEKYDKTKSSTNRIQDTRIN